MGAQGTIFDLVGWAGENQAIPPFKMKSYHTISLSSISHSKVFFLESTLDKNGKSYKDGEDRYKRMEEPKKMDG